MQRHEGRDGALVVGADSIVITHHDKGAGDREVALSDITDVHFERATRWTSGILTIAVNGAELVVPTGTAPGRDPLTVVFKYKSNDEFSQVFSWLRSIVSDNVGRN